MIQTARLDLIHALHERTQRLEAATRSPPLRDGVVPELVALEGLLLGQGFGPGTLVEWQNAGPGSGAVTLALVVAGQVLAAGGALVLIDEAREFYPPAAARLGVPLEHTVVVRPDDPQAGLWAWEQALRCPAVAVTLGWANELTDRYTHRLQLAVETGGGLGFLLRPAGQQAGPAKAAVRLKVSAVPGPGHRNRLAGGCGLSYCNVAVERPGPPLNWTWIMKRTLCLWFPNWPIQRRRRSTSHDRKEFTFRAGPAPARTQTFCPSSCTLPRGKVRVMACSPAHERGVATGMLLAEAQALFAHNAARFEPHEPHADRAALRELALWCGQFSPRVAVDAEVPPDCLLLDVTGCGYGFGGERGLATEAVSALRERGYWAVAASADTIGAAWAVAHSSLEGARWNADMWSAE